MKKAQVKDLLDANATLAAKSKDRLRRLQQSEIRVQQLEDEVRVCEKQLKEVEEVAVSRGLEVDRLENELRGLADLYACQHDHLEALRDAITNAPFTILKIGESLRTGEAFQVDPTDTETWCKIVDVPIPDAYEKDVPQDERNRAAAEVHATLNRYAHGLG